MQTYLPGTFFLLLLAPASASAQEANRPATYVFPPFDTAATGVRVGSEHNYTGDRGYGFESESLWKAGKPFDFSVAVPEGNYRVSVMFGSDETESETTVRAELRRLMIERVTTEKGKFATRSFIVNVRRPTFPGGEVKLKDREKKDEWWAWDEKLTLSFHGLKPRVASVRIEPAAAVTTLYLLGDSTVCDQPLEPYASWGQMLPRFFDGKIAVANHAESGESLRSSLGAHRLDKVLSTIRKGDYLFLQYGHNDMKVVTADSYKADLKRFVSDARAKGATVVLVTPVNRRTFQGTTVTNSLKDFPDAVRSLAKEESCPLIDLHAMSKVLYESLGPDKSGQLFKPGDGTHHNNYGAHELARCVVEGVRTGIPELAKHLADDATRFDPTKPDALETFRLPVTPSRTTGPSEGK